MLLNPTVGPPLNLTRPWHLDLESRISGYPHQGSADERVSMPMERRENDGEREKVSTEMVFVKMVGLRGLWEFLLFRRES